jgi:DNA replication protein DnaC
MKNPDALQARAKALHLHGLLAHWPEAAAAGWAPSLIGWEEDERARRSLERRLQGAHIGRFKPSCDFDWGWPSAIDRATFEALMTLDFLKDATNAVLVGPNGVGKSTLALNLAHEALIHGHTVLFTSAGQLLCELASLDSDSALRRRLRYYVAPTLPLIDEVGYPTPIATPTPDVRADQPPLRAEKYHRHPHDSPHFPSAQVLRRFVPIPYQIGEL